MRILFYLPAVTAWWFEHVVEPMLRRLAPVAEVHVLAPAPWNSTGIGPDDLARCLDLDGVAWHIVDDADHPSLRTAAADPQAVVDFVAALAPDVTLCRTADFATAARLPGAVRFLMEVAAAPFVLPVRTVTITDRPFASGIVPPFAAPDAAQIDAAFVPLWTQMQARRAAALPDRAATGVDAPYLLLPLEYEHPDNFFLQHRRPHVDTLALVAEVARATGPDCALVVTDHPLNALHVDRTGFAAALAAMGAHVRLAGPGAAGSTAALARHAAGMIVGESKSFSLAAAFGVPLLRRTRFATADWLRAESDLATFVAAVRAGTARAPAADDARHWFGGHLANDAFDPQDAALTGADLIDRLTRPLNPARWDAGLGRVRAAQGEAAA